MLGGAYERPVVDVQHTAAIGRNTRFLSGRCIPQHAYGPARRQHGDDALRFERDGAVFAPVDATGQQGIVGQDGYAPPATRIFRK